jgi:hypothetical protein
MNLSSLSSDRQDLDVRYGTGEGENMKRCSTTITIPTWISETQSIREQGLRRRYGRTEALSVSIDNVIMNNDNILCNINIECE